MTDLSKLFGQLRAMLHRPVMDDMAEIRKLLDLANSIAPEQYAQEWLPYLESHSPRILLYARSHDELDHIIHLVPSSAPIGLKFQGKGGEFIQRNSLHKLFNSTHLHRVTHLHFINLNLTRHIRLNQEDLFAPLFKSTLPNVSHINIGYCQLGNTFVTACCRSQLFSLITSLRLQHNTSSFGVSLLGTLLELNTLSSLETLDLAHSYLSKQDLDALTKHPLPKTLKLLDLQHSNTSEKVIAQLMTFSEALTNQHITIKLNDNP